VTHEPRGGKKAALVAEAPDAELAQFQREVSRNIAEAMVSLRQARELVRLLMIDAAHPGQREEVDRATILSMAGDMLSTAICVLVWPYEGALVEKLAAFTVENVGKDGVA